MASVDNSVYNSSNNNNNHNQMGSHGFMAGDHKSELTLSCWQHKKHKAFHVIDNKTVKEILLNYDENTKTSFVCSKRISEIPINSRKFKFHIIDCRYEYEHRGGNIARSMNVPTIEGLKSHFFSHKSRESVPTSQITTDPQSTQTQNFHKPILIFHCEHSEERAPAMLKRLREIDRELNTYPELNYPEIYLLDGGYKKFFQTFNVAFCQSIEEFEKQKEIFFTKYGYVPMMDEKFTEELIRIRSGSKSMAMGSICSQKGNMKSKKHYRPPLRSLSKTSSRRLFN